MKITKFTKILFLSSVLLLIAIIIPFVPTSTLANTCIFELKEEFKSSSTSLECYSDYNLALDALNQNPKRDLAIYKNGTLVYAKYGFADVSDYGNNETIKIYSTTSPEERYRISYIVGSNYYGSFDLAFLDYNNNADMLKVKIAGVTGWIRRDRVTVVPTVKVNRINSYDFGNNSITHRLVESFSSVSGFKTQIDFDKNTTNLKGVYYSYDGNYFYQDWYIMLDDYKNNHNNNALNKDEPYYNYYQFLPHHTKTTYSPTDINNIIYSRMSGFSKLLGEGTSFYIAQENYGINAMLNLSLAFNESDYGKSAIALNKNNFFGHNAVDSDPNNSAQINATARRSVFSSALSWGTYLYSFPSEVQFFGGQLGNKRVGYNVQYASDPYWAEKAAANYYSMDTSLGGGDRNHYQLAIKNSSSLIYPRRTLNDSSIIQTPGHLGTNYNYQRPGSVVVVIGEETDSTGQAFYKIMSDTNLNANRLFVPNGGIATTRYDWDQNYVYVPVSAYTKINVGKNGYESPSDTIEYDEKNYIYNEYVTNNNATPRVARIVNATSGYHTAKLASVIGKHTLNKNTKVMVYGEARDNNNNIIAYQISGQTSTHETIWVRPNDITFINNQYANLNFSKKAYWSVGVRSTTDLNEAVTGTIYGNMYLPVNEIKIVDGYEWINFSYDNSSRWIRRTQDHGVVVATMDIYTPTITNNKPVITASNQTLVIGNSFNPLQFVTATDIEDGNITNKVTIKSNNVNINVLGKYQVTYQVIDNHNEVAEKTIEVTVVAKKDVTASYYLDYFKVINNNIVIKGYNTTRGYDMSDASKVTFKLIFIDLDDETKKYEQELITTTNKNEMEYPVFETDKDYTYSRFSGVINFDILPDGDYQMIITTETNLAISKTVVSNRLLNDQVTSFTKTKTITTRNNYMKKETPIELLIRNHDRYVKSGEFNYNQFDQFEEFKFTNDNKLKIFGTSFSYGLNLALNSNINRTIHFENIQTKEITSLNLGSTSSGLYDVYLPTKDNYLKQLAWYNTELDISGLPKGRYKIFITNSSNIKDIGELRNSLLDDLSVLTRTFNNKTYRFETNNNRNSRVELIIS